jgi:putative membrane protein
MANRNSTTGATMIVSAIVAYLHYLSLGVIYASLATELFTLKSELTSKLGWRILMADTAYGIAGLLVLTTGILRFKYYGSGSDFYSSQPLFWVKMALFILVGLLSLYPTISFLGWIKDLRQDQVPKLESGRIQLLQKIIITELVGFSLIPLTASMMARGVGYEWWQGIYQHFLGVMG